MEAAAGLALLRLRLPRTEASIGTTSGGTVPPSSMGTTPSSGVNTSDSTPSIRSSGAVGQVGRAIGRLSLFRGSYSRRIVTRWRVYHNALGLEAAAESGVGIIYTVLVCLQYNFALQRISVL